MRGWARTLVVLTACSGGGGGGGGCNSDGTTDGTDCPEFLLDQFPEPGATDVFERTAVDAVAGSEAPGATIHVTDSGGADVAGTSTSDRGYFSFQVDGSYTPGETYTVVLSGWSHSTNCPDETWTFTVTDTPLTPLADTSTLEGRTWQLDLRQGRAVFPFNMDDVLADQMKVDLLVGVLDSPGTDLALRASSTTEARDAQDLDSDTTDFTAAFDENPYLRVEEDRLRLVIFNDVITAMDLTLTSAWDGVTWVETAIHTVIDTRELIDVVVTDPDPADSAVCDLFSSTFGVRCHDCPASDDLFPEGGTYCITMVVDGMTMSETGYQLDQVPPEG